MLTFGISLPLTIGRINDIIPVSYTPSFDITYHWDPDGIDPADTGLLGPTIAIRQNISVSNVNWKGNFRDGYEGSLWGPCFLRITSGIATLPTSWLFAASLRLSRKRLRSFSGMFFVAA